MCYVLACSFSVLQHPLVDFVGVDTFLLLASLLLRPWHCGGGRRSAANSLSLVPYKHLSHLVLFHMFLRQKICEVVHVKGFDLLKGHLESLGGHFTHYVHFYHPESLKRALHTGHIFLQLNHAHSIHSIELIRLVANMASQTYDAKKTIPPQLL